MQPLDSLLLPLTARVNKTLRETTPARDIAGELEGKSFAIRIRNSALAMALSIEDGELRTRTTIPEDPDVVVEGPLSGLTRMALAGDDVANLSGTGVTLSGHADVAQKFQRLLKLARPDPEEELSGYIGDAAAHQAGQALRGFADWGRRSADIMVANVREYLQEEQRELPSRYEMNRFRDDVQRLRDDVERAEARLRQLEARQK